ncbi:unnamed protein product [Camellia sinensis]
MENKGVEDFGDVIKEGGGALAKGLFRGVTGILTKPLEGAKASGVEGFVQGVGKGIIGAAAQPVKDQLLRRRLPRVISGDSLLRPYDEYKAEGQVILQLAESGSVFGQVDLFKQTSNIIAQKKFNPARDPCSVLWDVLLDDLVTMELTHGKKDQQNAPPSRLILYLQTRSAESKEPVIVVKCYHESNQAFEVYSSIDQAMNTCGPSQSKATLKRIVTKPYSPIADISSAEVIPKEVAYMWPPQQVPASVPLSSTFGSSANLI